MKRTHLFHDTERIEIVVDFQRSWNIARGRWPETIPILDGEAEVCQEGTGISPYALLRRHEAVAMVSQLDALRRLVVPCSYIVMWTDYQAGTLPLQKRLKGFQLTGRWTLRSLHVIEAD